jgi:hypothetical protein
VVTTQQVESLLNLADPRIEGLGEFSGGGWLLEGQPQQTGPSSEFENLVVPVTYLSDKHNVRAGSPQHVTGPDVSTANFAHQHPLFRSRRGGRHRMSVCRGP